MSQNQSQKSKWDHSWDSSGLGSRSSHQEIRKFYADWANEYDREYLDNLGYAGHKIAAETLAKWVKNKDARILDAGAGTGLVGECLQQLGYNNLDALDISPEMLAIAEKKGIYKNMYVDTLGGPTPIQLPSNQYDAVLIIGAITHTRAASLDELIRITRHNGVIIFTLRVDVAEDPDNEYDFKQKLPQLECEKKVELLANPRTAYRVPYDCFMYSYRVLKDTE
ncbi:uncharacterized protein LOC106165388 [Lingula anatina]|uniref:Uncharacterized protein LOC106165388 n=1 Tax=Lingula anatina TaxID=7574 RepID=A0A1S3ILF6_LINAN|nr:uncharacterized protein LOC106165388 [Lingula anatina]|eukprot:XP_013399052.1 uncharacterized protein LOC106165388 [Lingula anatina]